MHFTFQASIACVDSGGSKSSDKGKCGGGGGVYPDPEIRGDPVLNENFFLKIIFLALRAPVWSKNKGRAGLPWPLPWIRHWLKPTRA